MKNASDEQESAHLATIQREDKNTDQIGCAPFGLDINRYGPQCEKMSLQTIFLISEKQV